MGAKIVPHPPNPKAEVTAGIIRRLAQVIVGTLLQAVILFLSAGRLAWGMAWAYLGVYVGVIVVTMMVLLKISPELIAERAQVRADAKSWDKPLAAIISLSGTLASCRSLSPRGKPGIATRTGGKKKPPAQQPAVFINPSRFQ